MVHYGTWTSKEWRRFYEDRFGDDFQIIYLIKSIGEKLIMSLTRRYGKQKSFALEISGVYEEAHQQKYGYAF